MALSNNPLSRPSTPTYNQTAGKRSDSIESTSVAAAASSTPKSDLNPGNVNNKAQAELQKKEPKSGGFFSSFISKAKPSNSSDFSAIASAASASPSSGSSSVDSSHESSLPKPDFNGSDLISSVGDKETGFRYKGGTFTQGHLEEAHNELIGKGYAFVGFHGTQEGVAELKINEGVVNNSSKVDKRDSSDKWNGLYVAKDPGVAAGYATQHDDQSKVLNGKTGGNIKDGKLIRMYLPKDVVDSAKVSDIHLADKSAPDNLSEKLGFPLGSDKVYIVSGAQGADMPEHETIASWGAAQGAVFIPSLLEVDKSGSGNIAKDNGYERSIS